MRKKNVYLSVVSKENRGRNDKKEENCLIKTWNKNENFIFVVFCGEFLLTLCVGLKCKMYFAQQSNNQTIFIFSFQFVKFLLNVSVVSYTHIRPCLTIIFFEL